MPKFRCTCTIELYDMQNEEQARAEIQDTLNKGEINVHWFEFVEQLEQPDNETETETET